MYTASMPGCSELLSPWKRSWFEWLTVSLAKPVSTRRIISSKVDFVLALNVRRVTCVSLKYIISDRFDQKLIAA